MLRITFFIGNGFDLNMGLRTSYDDFYKSLSNTTIENRIISKIKDDYSLWSDLEEGLGKYYTDSNQEQEDDFLESKNNLEILLGEYLKKEQDTAKFSDVKGITIKMKESILGFYKPLNKKNRTDVDNLVKMMSGAINYSFINFNYTIVFDKCINILKKGDPSVDFIRKVGTTNYKDTIGSVLHVNGTVDNKMILGVDNCKQLGYKTPAEKQKISQNMIKEIMNDSLGELRTEETKRIIDESLIICVYGMALGTTDRMWWYYLANWLSGNKDRRLIIYSYIKEGYRNSVYVINNIRDSIMSRFRNSSGVDADLWKKIEPRIYIQSNPVLFDFKLHDGVMGN